MAIQSMQLDPNAASYADLNDLDPTAATKLAGIDEGAEVNPDGDEMIAAIDLGIDSFTREDVLDQDSLNIVKTNPTAGEFPVKNIHRMADGKLDIEYDDVAI